MSSAVAAPVMPMAPSATAFPDPPPPDTRVERVLGRVRGAHAGPTLLCVGGLHGNEPAGVRACERVVAALRAAAPTIAGRFIALAGAEVVELGPINTTIHKIDECVAVADLPVLASIYQTTAEHLLR